MKRMEPTEHQTDITLTDKHGNKRDLTVHYTYNWETKDLMFVRPFEDGKAVELGSFLPNEKARLMHELHQHAAMYHDPSVLDKILTV